MQERVRTDFRSHALEDPGASSIVLADRRAELAVIRERAHSPFVDAMDELKEIAQRLHHRNLLTPSN